MITSYETLAQETNYVDLPHSNSSEGRRFRNKHEYLFWESCKKKVASKISLESLCLIRFGEKLHKFFLLILKLLQII